MNGSHKIYFDDCLSTFLANLTNENICLDVHVYIFEVNMYLQKNRHS